MRRGLIMAVLRSLESITARERTQDRRPVSRAQRSMTVMRCRPGIVSNAACGGTELAGERGGWASKAPLPIGRDRGFVPGNKLDKGSKRKWLRQNPPATNSRHINRPRDRAPAL